ncbi:MAG: hypothetical protein ACREFK_04745 [Stellaceae bacterium]
MWVAPSTAPNGSLSALELSDHAAARAQQRGVSRGSIYLISQLADRRVRVPGGAHALSISERARERWVAGGLPPAEIERTRGVVLIADMAAGNIVTVEHIHGRRRRIRR